MRATCSPLSSFPLSLSLSLSLHSYSPLFLHKIRRLRCCLRGSEGGSLNVWELWLADVIHIWYERKHFKAFCIARLTQGRDRIRCASRRRSDDAQVSNLAPLPCFLPVQCSNACFNPIWDIRFHFIRWNGDKTCRALKEIHAQRCVEAFFLPPSNTEALLSAILVAVAYFPPLSKP